MDITPEPFKNEWTDEMAKEIDKYWTQSALEVVIHTIEALGCLQSCGSGESVLEVGCGTGHIWGILQHTNIGKYIGLDSSTAMLSVFKEKHPGVETILGDATELPFEDNSVGVAICLEVIRHITQYEKVIHELYRVAKKTAVFTVEVTQGRSAYSGEDRSGSYIKDKPKVLHYQVYHNTKQFIDWLGAEFDCKIDIKIITATKWMFVLNKDQPGLSWQLAPLEGMDSFLVGTIKTLSEVGKLLRTLTGTSINVLMNSETTSVYPLKLKFHCKLVTGEDSSNNES